MKRCYTKLLILALQSLLAVAAGTCYAQQGRDGAKTVSSPNTIVNEYTFLTANASAGNTSITVANSQLNTNNRFAGPLSSGDLVLIIQMQGATINGTAMDSTWGSITSYNNCGLYEFAVVSGVPNSNTIQLSCALQNNYTFTGKVQVVRLPRYTTLEVKTGGLLTADPWNGAQGGIIATEAVDSTTIDSGGAIIATGLGFRGGVYVNNSAGPSYTYIYSSTNVSMGGEQGEGIAGFENDYNPYGGRYCRGAPANGGGGGNAWNCPGGGGANAGNINAYTGNGNPDITTNANYITAWNLEYAGFANSTSSGGGRGGYNVGFTGPNPLVTGPNSASWSQYLRSNTGGKGGRPLDYSTGRIFFGGGGGACKADNNNGTSGANGGGMVYLISYGNVSGTGKIFANGNTALNANCGASSGDPPGGGGGGGTVIVYSTGTISGISITANGGNGGNQIINNGGESEGAGGGGGGGYIAISGGSINRLAAGGVNGTTNSAPIASFPPDGATKGGDGIANAVINNLPLTAVVANAGGNLTICSGDTAQLSASGGNTYLWTGDSTLSCTACAKPVVKPMATTTYLVTVSTGACSETDSVIITVLPSAYAGAISAAPDSVCSGGFTILNITGARGNIQWQQSSDGILFTGLSGQVYPSYTATGLAQTTYYRALASTTCGTDSSPVTKVQVFSPPGTGSVILDPNPVCAGSVAHISVSGVTGSLQWQIMSSPGTYTNITGADSLTYITPPLANSVGYRLVASNGVCADTSIAFNLLVNPAPAPPELFTPDSQICASDSALIRTSGTYAAYNWNNGDRGNHTYATQAGNYWVTVTDTNGCTAVSGHVSIYVYPVPSVSIIVQGDTLSSFGQSGYQWTRNGVPVEGATGPVYIVRQSGLYAVQVTDTNGCTTASNPVTVSGLQHLAEEHVSVYPNPSTGNWQLTVDNELLGSTMEIFDEQGRLVFQSAIRNLQSAINMDIPSGVYYLRISNDKVSVIRKLLKM